MQIQNKMSTKKSLKVVLLGLSLSLLSSTSWAAELGKKDWYVRLTASNAAENVKDSNNLLGQLKDSSNGYDSHDLIELPPFSAPYLTIVFPHQDWNDKAGDYATDYQSTKGRRHVWRFEVRSDNSNRDITLDWGLTTGNPKRSKTRMWLVDGATGDVIYANGKSKRKATRIQQYQFNMDGATSRTFYWVVGNKKLAQSQTDSDQ